jgi:uncharacterized protein
MENPDKERLKVLLIVVLGFILPILMICLGVVPFAWRFHILILAVVLIWAIAQQYSLTLQELGLTHCRLERSLKAIALPTLASALLMLIYFALQGARLDNTAYQWKFYLFFVFVSSPAQELLYRGFLFSIFSRAKLGMGAQVLLSAMLYSFVHLIYQDIPTILITLLMGILWGYHYATYRNLYSVIISHSLLGAIAILVGLV